jgi:hypothetical protein
MPCYYALSSGLLLAYPRLWLGVVQPRATGYRERTAQYQATAHLRMSSALDTYLVRVEPFQSLNV